MQLVFEKRLPALASFVSGFQSNTKNTKYGLDYCLDILWYQLTNLICLRYHGHLAEFGHGKYVAAAFFSTLGGISAYQARLVSPWVFWRDVVELKYEPWLDRTRLICRRTKKVWLGINIKLQSSFCRTFFIQNETRVFIFYLVHGIPADGYKITIQCELKTESRLRKSRFTPKKSVKSRIWK